MAFAPSDGAVALRSLPRRFRSVLVRGEDEDTDRPDHLVRRAGESGWSALDHAASVARSLRLLGRALEDVLVQEEPSLGAEVLDDAARGGPGEAAGAVADVLGAIAAETTQLADRVDRVSAKEWARTGTSGSRQVRALEILQEAVDSSVAHLKSAAAVVNEVRGRQ